jgi:hypothetical protein
MVSWNVAGMAQMQESLGAERCSHRSPSPGLASRVDEVEDIPIRGRQTLRECRGSDPRLPRLTVWLAA